MSEFIASKARLIWKGILPDDLALVEEKVRQNLREELDDELSESKDLAFHWISLTGEYGASCPAVFLTGAADGAFECTYEAHPKMRSLGTLDAGPFSGRNVIVPDVFGSGGET